MTPILLAGAALAAAAAAIILGVRRERRLRRRLARLERQGDARLAIIRGLCDLEVARRAPDAAITFHGQFGEDMILWRLFEGRRTGFYIEAGAYDGETYAVTLALERLGWTGVLVEPMPEHADACRRARPRSRVVHAALSRRGSTGHARFTQIISPERGHEASSFLASPAGAPRLARPPRRPTRTFDVPLTTLDDVLADHEGPIDVVVLDVEGRELDVLDGFDLERFRPRVLLVEDHSLGREPALGEFLDRRDYEHVMWISYNRLAVRRDQAELLARARALAGGGRG